jgi:UPF0755 protein
VKPARASARRGGLGLTVTAGLLALLVPVGGVVFARWAVDRAEAWLQAPFAAAATYPIDLEVAKGQGAASVARLLHERGVVADGRGFSLYLIASGQSRRLQAGEYRFEAPASPLQVADVLVEGRVRLHAFTIREGLDVREVAALLGETGWWTSEDLVAAFRDVALVADIDLEAREDLEGYLLPETYHLPRGASAGDLARAMVAGFRRTWNEIDGSSRAARAGLSTREVVTLASLVERETSLPDERGLVASVYRNRLRAGMRLECDPTVIHALRRDGAWTGTELTYADLRYPSPYNTYLNTGLPPGPICSSGRASLEAALEPADSDFVFFVADGTGGHRFAATEVEHRRNVLLWRRHEREVEARGPR